MNLHAYMAFFDEIDKIAEDASMRAQQADRLGLVVGKDYLMGGQLASNHPGETGFVPKLASSGLFSQERADRINKRLGAARDKFHEVYRDVRAPAGAAATGALYGTLASNFLTGGHSKGWKGYRIPMAVGASLGLADYFAQGKKRKTAGMATFTPGRQLTTGRNTNRFLQTVHKGGDLKPTTVGHNFKIPDNPTE